MFYLLHLLKVIYFLAKRLFWIIHIIRFICYVGAMSRKPIIITLTDGDILRIRQLSQQQTARYGHDRWHFSLWRADSSHEIGFVGEVGVLRFLQDTYQLQEPDVIGLEQMGDKFDVYIVLDGKKHRLHIKTGRRSQWPEDSMAFGVHLDQRIEVSRYPVVLVSFLKGQHRQIRIEWFMTAENLGACPIIKKWETFPKMRYPSRCDNRLTTFGQYQDITTIIDYLQTMH
jgi:hypothetical protein